MDFLSTRATRSRSSSRAHSLLPAEEHLSIRPWRTVVGRYIVADIIIARIAVEDEWIRIDFSHDLWDLWARINLSAAIADKSSRTSAGLTGEAWDQMCQSFLRKMADGWMDGREQPFDAASPSSTFPFCFTSNVVIILNDINSEEKNFRISINLRSKIFNGDLFEDDKIWRSFICV